MTYNQNSVYLSLKQNVKRLAGHQADTVAHKLTSEYRAFQKMCFQEELDAGRFHKAISGDIKAAAFILMLLGVLRVFSVPVPEPGVDPP